MRSSLLVAIPAGLGPVWVIAGALVWCRSSPRENWANGEGARFQALWFMGGIICLLTREILIPPVFRGITSSGQDQVAHRAAGRWSPSKDRKGVCPNTGGKITVLMILWDFLTALGYIQKNEIRGVPSWVFCRPLLFLIRINRFSLVILECGFWVDQA